MHKSRNPNQDILCNAIMEGNINAVQDFIHQGRDFRFHNDEPLRIAGRAKQFDIVKLLLKYGADINSIDFTCDSLLIELTKMGGQEHVDDMILYLLDHDADISLSDYRAFLFACARCDYSVIEKMIELQVNVNYIFGKTPFGTGLNPLLVAALTQRIEIIELLSQHGAQLDNISEDNLLQPATQRAIEFIKPIVYHHQLQQELPFNSHQLSQNKI